MSMPTRLFGTVTRPELIFSVIVVDGATALFAAGVVEVTCPSGYCVPSTLVGSTATFAKPASRSV